MQRIIRRLRTARQNHHNSVYTCEGEGSKRTAPGAHKHKNGLYAPLHTRVIRQETRQRKENKPCLSFPYFDNHISVSTISRPYKKKCMSSATQSRLGHSHTHHYTHGYTASLRGSGTEIAQDLLYFNNPTTPFPICKCIHAR